MRAGSDERPRERLRRLGAAALSDAELIALVLGTGRPGQPVEALAQQLLDQIGGLHALVSVEARALGQLKGVGAARTAQLCALGEIAIRAATIPLRQGERLLSAQQVFAAFAPRLRNERREQFLAIGLDAKRRVIGHTCVAVGHLTSVDVHPREVFRPLVREAAAAAVVVHNHPSGDPTPSVEDVALTRRLARAGLIVGIELLDHVVVGDGHFASMRKEVQVRKADALPG